MLKSSNILIFFATCILSNSALPSNSYNVSIFTDHCPNFYKTCINSKSNVDLHSTLVLDDLVDVEFRDLVTLGINTNGKNIDFDKLKSIYNNLTKGDEVPNEVISNLIEKLRVDVSDRERLYRYALSERFEIENDAFHQVELNHYYKEIKSLKSLKRINEKQIKKLEAFESQIVKSTDKLRHSLEQQSRNLLDGMDVISTKLENDIYLENMMINYLSARGVFQ